MNIFLISPGRTATTTFSEAFKKVEGYTSSHESRCQYLGEDRVLYPKNHFECDNRLVWFLPRLTEKYSKTSILVNIIRDRNDIAKSYNKRWAGIRIMKSYSQGILMRPVEINNFDVCLDYVNNAYEHIKYFSKDWKYYIEIDIENPRDGVEEICRILNLSPGPILEYLSNNHLNKNENSLRKKLRFLKANIKNAFFDFLFA